jgi:hypothetical protein
MIKQEHPDHPRGVMLDPGDRTKALALLIRAHGCCLLEELR